MVKKGYLSKSQISRIENQKTTRISESLARAFAKVLNIPAYQEKIPGERERTHRYCLNCGESYFLNCNTDQGLPKLYDKCPSCQSKKTEWVGSISQLFAEISVKLGKLAIIFNLLEFDGKF